MYAKLPLLITRLLSGPVLACALTCSAVAGDKFHVIVFKRIDTAGLDLNRAADAQTLYTRIRHAADDVCTRGNRVDLLPVDSPKRCYEKALGDAVRSTGSPMLTQIYLGTHSLQEAKAHGIEAPSELAAIR